MLDINGALKAIGYGLLVLFFAVGVVKDVYKRQGWILRGCAVWDKMTSRPQKGRFRQQSEYIVWGSNGPMPVNRPVGCLPGVDVYKRQALLFLRYTGKKRKSADQVDEDQGT